MVRPDEVEERYGMQGEARTPNPRVWSAVLCQLELLASSVNEWSGHRDPTPTVPAWKARRSPLDCPHVPGDTVARPSCTGFRDPPLGASHRVASGRRSNTFLVRAVAWAAADLGWRRLSVATAPRACLPFPASWVNTTGSGADTRYCAARVWWVLKDSNLRVLRGAWVTARCNQPLCQTPVIEGAAAAAAEQGLPILRSINGASYTIQTCDPRLRRPVLYPLS